MLRRIGEGMARSAPELLVCAGAVAAAALFGGAGVAAADPWERPVADTGRSSPCGEPPARDDDGNQPTLSHSPAGAESPGSDHDDVVALTTVAGAEAPIAERAPEQRGGSHRSISEFTSPKSRSPRTILRATTIQIRLPDARPAVPSPAVVPLPAVISDGAPASVAVTFVPRPQPVAAPTMTVPPPHTAPWNSALNRLGQHLHALPGEIAANPLIAVPGVIALVLLTVIAGFVGYRWASTDTGHQVPGVSRFLR